MIYFGENDSFIFAECEDCKRELKIEKEQVNENTAFFCKLAMPVKCVCERVDDVVKKDRQSTYSIRHQISALLDILHKKNTVETKMDEITAELNYSKKPPAYFSIIYKDIVFSLKLFLILLGVGLGLELLLFIVCGLIFLGGLAFQTPNICLLGNELLYNLNMLKGYGGNLLKSFNFSEEVPLLDRTAASEKFIIDYIPYAVAGVIRVVFIIGIVALSVRLAITLIRIIYYITVVLSKKYQINQGREENEATLSNLSLRLQDLNEQILEYPIIPADFRNLKDVETIYSYFLNNRVDSVREALNLCQSENFAQKNLDYQRALYGEAKLTKKYTKALYILTSDETAQVEVKEESDDLENYKMKHILQSAVTGIKNRKKPIKKSGELHSGNTSYYDKKKIASKSADTPPKRLPTEKKPSDKN